MEGTLGGGESDSDEVAVRVSAEDTKKERKTRFAYKESDDIKLLKELLGDEGIFVEGMKETHQWRAVHKRMKDSGMDVSEHSLRRRLKTIHEAYCSAERKSRQASGIDETVDERTQLLEAYDELLREQKAEEAERKNKKDDIHSRNEEGGRVIRDAALETFQRSNKGEYDKEKSKFDINEYLQENLRVRSQEVEDRAAAKRRRLELDTRQMVLQERMIETQLETAKMQREMMAMMAALIEKHSK
ncbi:unnamed protein product [Aphanomyces euteiches]